MSDASTVVKHQPRLVHSVTHAASLLKSLQHAGHPMSLSDLSRKAQLSKPATYALLRTLELSHLVVRDETARYCLGWGLYELGSAVAVSDTVVRTARTHLSVLAEATGCVVLLAILDGETVLYLDRRQADTSSFEMVADMGRRGPLHSTASGKVLLAFQPADFIRAFVDRPLVPATSATVTAVHSFVRQLEAIRERGYATSLQEQEIGLSSVSVPIFDARGVVQAALTVAGPIDQLVPRFPTILEQLRTVVGKISSELAARSRVS